MMQHYDMGKKGNFASDNFSGDDNFLGGNLPAGNILGAVFRGQTSG